eukprot:11786650-Alexandrium_andersonii.AAC.1
MASRGRHVLSQFGPLSTDCCVLVDAYTTGCTTAAGRRPARGCTAFAHTPLSHVIGVSQLAEHAGADEGPAELG